MLSMQENIAQVKLGFKLLGAAFLLMVCWVVGHWLLSLYVDVLWFQSVGYKDVFTKILKSKLLLFGISGTVAAVFVVINAVCALRARRSFSPKAPALPEEILRKNSLTIFLLLAIGSCFFFGVSGAHHWDVFLRFIYRDWVGLRDPIYQRDIAFYFFTLPLANYLIAFYLWLIGISAAVVAGIYFLREEISLETRTPSVGSSSFRHLSILAGMGMIVISVSFYFAQYSMLSQKSAALSGPGYAEIYGLRPAYLFMCFLALIGSFWFFGNAFVQFRPGNLYVICFLALLWFIAVLVYPFLLRVILVKPNEFEREMPFIEHSIKMTRAAYALDNVREIIWQGDAVLNQDTLSRHAGTVDNLMLWDEQQMREVLQQKQRIRSYYDLSEVDTDRYEIEGRLRPVMIALRELQPDLLPETHRVWTNVHLQYTHGYALCLALANQATQNGSPEFVLANLPPNYHPDIPLHQPRIYFGEATRHYVVVNTRIKEFDYPGDEQNFFYEYEGNTGIPIAGFMRRFLLALYTGDKELFLTKQFTEHSRILLYRQIRERLLKLAPFLSFDDDPYPVVCNGRIFWVVDAYTTSGTFPYSESVGRTNYLRNSVKAVIDAYDGSVQFYQTDEKEPLLKVYATAFPELFKDLEDMPSELRQHIRYPKDLFRVQSVVFRRYHVVDPQVFFNGEDTWAFPRFADSSGETYDSPRFVVMELPGSDHAEQFVLTHTFTVEGKDNMIAWMTGGCDGEEYGHLTVYRLPKGRNIYGPAQMRGRFNQDPEVSSFTTLMGQVGSTVVSTAVLPVPVEDGLLYIQSLFIVDPQVKIPELKQVILGHGDKVSVGATVTATLERLFDTRLGVASDTWNIGPLRNREKSWSDAETLYDLARQRLKEGDWAGFGKAFDDLGELLKLKSEDKAGTP